MQNKFFKYDNREDDLTLEVMASEVKEGSVFFKKGGILLKSTMRGEDNGTYYELDETIECSDFPKDREVNAENVLEWVVPHFADQYERVADHRDAFVPFTREQLLLSARELFDTASALVAAAGCKLSYDDAEGSGVVHALPEDVYKSEDGSGAPFAETIANGPEMLTIRNTYCETNEGTDTIPDWWEETSAKVKSGRSIAK